MKRDLSLEEDKSVIGLIVPAAMEYYWNKVIRSVEETAQKHGYQVISLTTNYNSTKEIRQIKKLLKKGVKGIILEPFDREENIRYYLELKKKKITLIFISTRLEQVKTDYIVPDHLKGAYKTVKHLVGMGHKRIGYIGVTLEFLRYFEQLRLSGYRKALKESGIKFDRELVIETKGVASDIGYKAVKRFMKMKQAPTAIFALDDSVAIGALAATKEAGKKIPEDFALAGYDDSPLATSIDPPLTSVALPRKRMGRKAVEILLERIGQEGKGRPHRIILEPKLIVRESSLTLRGPEKRKCLICGKTFYPWRKNLRQMVCSHPACQKARQKENVRQWRERYADYFAKDGGDSSWRQYRLEGMKEWRQKHREHLRHYRQVHQGRHRDYMRGYMRKYRKKAMLGE